ncbi:hypothetical protein ACFVZ3_06360 [Kitasatospora purpeofusca]|uniref:hypothetical protein n=1 Tax=Kitasatospora purpeofusca TaxID=67352 RepID=UPI00367919E4
MKTIGGPGLYWPWPELMPDRRPVLVLPADPGRDLDPEEGWASRESAPVLTAASQVGWSATLNGYRLTIDRPGGQAWFDGEIAATREWSRSVRAHRLLLLVTGPFTSVLDFQTAAAAGLLLLLTTAVQLPSSL